MVANPTSSFSHSEPSHDSPLPSGESLLFGLAFWAVHDLPISPAPLTLLFCRLLSIQLPALAQDIPFTWKGSLLPNPENPPPSIIWRVHGGNQLVIQGGWINKAFLRVHVCVFRVSQRLAIYSCAHSLVSERIGGGPLNIC